MAPQWPAQPSRKADREASAAQCQPPPQESDSDRERLLRNTKRQVKQMMEEAIARKFIHEDSASMLALCVTVDSCLTHGLRRRALGLFKTSSSTALVKRIASRCGAASQVLEQVEAELRGWSAPDAAAALSRNLWIRRALVGKRLVEIVEYLAERAHEFYERQALMSSQVSSQILISLLVGPSALDFSSGKLHNGFHHHQAAEPSADELLRRHRLANRVACLCHGAAQPLPGARDELAGCARPQLEASPACPSAGSSQQQVPKQATRRRPLALKKTAAKRGATLATDCHHYSCQEMSEHQPATRGYSLVDAGSTSSSQQPAAAHWPLWSPSMLHEVLHQNAKSRLLYAKNNILLEVQARAADVPGYLSLHETSQSELIMNWVPNQMIKGGTRSKKIEPETEAEAEAEAHSASVDAAAAPQPEAQGRPEFGSQATRNENTQQGESVESSFLELVVSLSVSRIVLIQCQFQRPSGGSDLAAPERLMLVEADGVQGAPFKFPKGGLRQFLACLDGGLRPQRRLEPAIWVEDAGGGSPLDWRCALAEEQPASPQSDTNSDNSAPAGRLDSLLKRLPSLRRRGPQLSNTINNNYYSFPFDSHLLLSDSSASNFVYRIVADSATPEAGSLNNISSWSSSSSSPPLPAPLHTHSLASRLHTTASAETPAPQSPSLPATSRSEPAEANRFQWSLKRLARLSYKYSNSSSAGSSSILNQSAASTSAASDSIPHTNDHLSSIHYLHNNNNNHDYQNPPATDIGCAPVEAHDEKRRNSSRQLAKVQAKLQLINKSTSEDVLLALRTSSIQALCDSMRKQILARAFYGWLAYCRRARIIRVHLKKLVKENPFTMNSLPEGEPEQLSAGLSMESWQRLMGDTSAERAKPEDVAQRVCLSVYHGGIESDQLRHQVWPYLLEYYSFHDQPQQKKARDDSARKDYESQGREWIQVERVVKQRDSEILAANIARAGKANKMKSSPDLQQPSGNHPPPEASEKHLSAIHDEEADDSFDEQPLDNDNDAKAQPRRPRAEGKRRYRLESTGSVGSDASITDHFGNNIHRIDKDVQRCDRNFWYFKEPENLNKLRNIMCTYVWKHLDMGYVQGMCDLAAPLLVILDDECLAYNCFCQLMKRMVANFPHGRAMDEHFESLKHLMQIMDPKLFEILESNGDYAHFYFCYRWLLLDFKRELAYEDVYKAWETIWAARFVATDHFVVFMALAMVRYYRDIIIDNNMDFTDTIKFFNEMAERHDTKMILALARDCIVELQYLIKIS